MLWELEKRRHTLSPRDKYIVLVTAVNFINIDNFNEQVWSVKAVLPSFCTTVATLILPYKNQNSDTIKANSGHMLQ